jgi:hypothetical protein
MNKYLEKSYGQQVCCMLSPLVGRVVLLTLAVGCHSSSTPCDFLLHWQRFPASLHRQINPDAAPLCLAAAQHCPVPHSAAVCRRTDAASEDVDALLLVGEVLWPGSCSRELNDGVTDGRRDPRSATSVVNWWLTRSIRSWWCLHWL